MVRPSFDSLPLRKEDPPFSAWGLYGNDDELGTLNLLTPEVVREAASEIKTGIRVGLNLPLTIPFPGTHNRSFSHRLIYKAPRNIHDDVVDMNTQCSSQWDGFYHFGYQKPPLFYNGVTADEVSGSKAGSKKGTSAWCDQGIVGRGVLLDFFRYAEAKGEKIDSFGTRAISLSELLDCAESQKVAFKEGDILLIRIGWKGDYLAMSQEERVAMTKRVPFTMSGVDTNREMAKWIWETGFSACGGDTLGFETMGTDRESEERGLNGLHLHEVMLGGWGMPIGEMLDLDALSDECLKQKRWSFFLTSMPLNVPNGIASPANLVAIF